MSLRKLVVSASNASPLLAAFCASISGCIIRDATPSGQPSPSGAAVTTRSASQSAQGAADNDTIKINRFLDAWHNTAAKADENLYFGSMTEIWFFVGTDKKSDGPGKSS